MNIVMNRPLPPRRNNTPGISGVFAGQNRDLGVVPWAQEGKRPSPPRKKTLLYSGNYII